MIRYLLAAGSAILLLAATVPSRSDTAIPVEITIPSSVGKVTFLHKKHIEDRAIPCAACHHQIDAKKLSTPHPDYLKSSWINCTACHDESGKTKQSVFTCSACHPTNPKNIADETLSAKVVIHKQCWKCHAVSTGKEASKSCELCHSGKRTP